MVWFYKLIAMILALFIYSPASEIASYTTSIENPKLTFTVLSDVHLEGNNKDRFNLFGEGIRDINAYESNDFVVFLGDNTMNGQVVELSAFYGILDKYNTLDTYMVTGNHDLCPSDYNVGDYEDLRNRFFKYKKEYSKTEYDDNVYYSVNISDEFQLIVLGSESDAGVNEDLSDTQLAWLENELKLAESNNKTVFIFNHYPLNHTWSDVWADGHIGEDSEKLHEILKSSENRIIYFSGHLHMGFYDNRISYVNEDNITYISVPSFGADNNVGNAHLQDNGMGLCVEVYEDNILIRTRDFANHEWKNISLELH